MKKQCVSIENNLKNNNTNMAYQTVKELTNTKQRRVSVIQDKAGKCLTEEHASQNTALTYTIMRAMATQQY